MPINDDIIPPNAVVRAHIHPPPDGIRWVGPAMIGDWVQVPGVVREGLEERPKIEWGPLYQLEPNDPRQDFFAAPVAEVRYGQLMPAPEPDIEIVFGDMKFKVPHWATHFTQEKDGALTVWDHLPTYVADICYIPKGAGRKQVIAKPEAYDVFVMPIEDMREVPF